MDTTINRSRTTAESVAASLREEILRGVLAAGSALKQDRIASRFSVSTIPVREALFRLTDEGLVEFIPNRGAFVSSVSACELRELYIVRERLEALALEHAFDRLTDEVLESAETMLALMETEEDVYAWGELHWQFHAALYEPCELPRLMRILRSLHVNLIRYLVSKAIDPEALDFHLEIDKEHRKLLNVCWEGDRDVAVIYLKRHLDHSSRVLVQIGEER